MSNKRKHMNLVGQRFGKLVVIKEVDRNKFGHVQWLCQCDCGNTAVASTTVLRAGRRISCGCAQPRYFSNNKRLYTVWRGMIDRCENPNAKSYKDYGARGIAVCASWHTFKNFLDWSIASGYDQDAPFGAYTLDRIDTNGNYCAENCRWVSIKQQARNNRHNHMVTINGETMPLVAAAEKYGISINTVKMRIRNGWSDVDAIITPSARAGSKRQRALLKLPYLVEQR